jgi:hypothetical protein
VVSKIKRIDQIMVWVVSEIWGDLKLLTNNGRMFEVFATTQARTEKFG